MPQTAWVWRWSLPDSGISGIKPTRVVPVPPNNEERKFAACFWAAGMTKVYNSRSTRLRRFGIQSLWLWEPEGL